MDLFVPHQYKCLTVKNWGSKLFLNNEAIIIHVLFYTIIRRAKALFDCDAEDDLELSFHEEELLYNGNNII